MMRVGRNLLMYRKVWMTGYHVEFADNLGDVVVPGEGVVDFEAEKFCCWFLGEVVGADGEVDVGVVVG